MEALVLAFILVLICVFLFGFPFSNMTKKHHNFPPSPPGSFPVIGHLHLLGKSPHKSLMELSKRHGGLMYLKLGSINTLVASTPDAAKQVLKTLDHIFATRPYLHVARILSGNGLLCAPYGKEWRDMRKLCTVELFTTKSVEMLKPLRKLEMGVLITDLHKQRIPVNMSSKLLDLTFNTMTRVVMNKSFSEQECSVEEKQRVLSLKEILAEACEMVSNTRIGDFLPSLWWLDTGNAKFHEMARKMDDIFQTVLDERRKRWASNPVAESFIDVMLSTGNLSDIRMKGLTLDIIAGGMDTSAVTIAWGLSEIVRNPEKLMKLREELDEVVGKDRTMEEENIPKLKYLQATVKEVLRLHPAGPLCNPHESMEDCTVGNFFVPAKTRLLVNAYAIGRDGNVWKEPEKFEPERFLGENPVDVRGNNFELLPFGSGRRMCPGMNLALSTVHYGLGSLVHAFDWYMPGDLKPENLDMEENFGITLSRANPLMLMPSPRLSEQAYKN